MKTDDTQIFTMEIILNNGIVPELYYYQSIKRYGRHDSSTLPTICFKNVTWDGFLGTDNSRIPASSGVRLPLKLLQRIHAVIRFSHVSSPPRDLGMI